MFSGEMSEKPIKVLSGGEKSRVLIGKLLAHETNVLLLDEPTNHLDMESITSLSREIQNYAGAAVIVTHNQFLLREAKITKFIVFHQDSIIQFDGTYDEFLEKVGWGDDEEMSSTKKAKKEAKSKHVI